MNTQELSKVCRQVRRDIITMTANAGSGHPGGSLSAVELMTSVFFNHMRVDPSNPHDPDRDRFVLSKGHAAPCYYAVLAAKGFISRDEYANFRQLHSILQGHPDAKKVPGVDASTGSLGQGVSIAVGMALGAKHLGKDTKVFALVGDGESQEGQIWEAYMAAAHYKLDNLTVIIDNNGLQIDGSNDQVMSLGDLGAKLRAFGFDLVELPDGNDLDAVEAALSKPTMPGKPKAILAHGQGQGRFVHGKSSRLARQGAQRRAARSGFEGIGGLTNMADKIATRQAYGEALIELVEKNDKVVVLDADLANATQTCKVAKAHPEKFYNFGIAEANMVDAAAGMSTMGLVPFCSTFAMFAAGRAYEQIRNSVAYPHFNVKICATHAGVSVGEDGGSHQCIEDLALMRVIPGMTVICPADANEAKAATMAIADFDGPVYMRLARLATPVFEGDMVKPFVLGKANVLREGKDVAIFATGLMVNESLMAAEALAKDGIDAAVINVHTIKPIDAECVTAWAEKCGRVITVEEHSVIGGLGDAVAGVLMGKVNCKFHKIGVNDQFGQSGKAADVLREYGLTADQIAATIKANI